MSSVKQNSRYMFCVCYTDRGCGRKFYVNYVADPREKTSIKLPEFMVKLSQQLGMKRNYLEESIDFVTNELEIERSILRSIVALYGPRMPAIYLTEDGDGLVLDIHIFKGHAEALTKLPFMGPKDGCSCSKWRFLYSTMDMIRMRIVTILDRSNDDEWIDLPWCQLELLTDRVRMPPGDRASTERIWSIVEIAPDDEMPAEELEERDRIAWTSSRPVEVGDKVFCLGWTDEQLQRSVYYNIVASDESDSLRLPAFMLDIARSPTERKAFSLTKAMITDRAGELLSDHIFDSLMKYYRQHEPQIFVARDDQTDLVINVPMHIEHARMLSKCFPAEAFMRPFSWGFMTYYVVHWHRKLLYRDPDLQCNINSYLISERPPKETGRKATTGEIYSLLLKRSAFQPSHKHIFKRFHGFMERHDIDFSNRRDSVKHLEHTIHELWIDGPSNCITWV